MSCRAILVKSLQAEIDEYIKNIDSLELNRPVGYKNEIYIHNILIIMKKKEIVKITPQTCLI